MKDRVYLLAFVFIPALVVVYKVSLIGFYMIGFLVASVIIVLLLLNPPLIMRKIYYTYLLSLVVVNVFMIIFAE